MLTRFSHRRFNEGTECQKSEDILQCFFKNRSKRSKVLSLYGVCNISGSKGQAKMELKYIIFPNMLEMTWSILISIFPNIKNPFSRLVSKKIVDKYELTPVDTGITNCIENIFSAKPHASRLCLKSTLSMWATEKQSGYQVKVATLYHRAASPVLGRKTRGYYSWAEKTTAHP